MAHAHSAGGQKSTNLCDARLAGEDVMAATSNSGFTSLVDAEIPESEWLSAYTLGLDVAAKNRYLEKLKYPPNKSDKTLYLPDPYHLSTGWTDETTEWPDLGFGDIYCYLIETPGAFTKSALKAYKSLEAYRFVVSGHVQTVHYNPIKDDVAYCVLKTKVIPSQKLREKPHQPWVYLEKESATVLCAHCTCMAGLGEVCSHVAALLFKIEMGVHLGLTSVSSTSKACQWNKTFRKDLLPMTITDLQDKIRGRRTKPVPSVIASGRDPLPDTDILMSLKQVCPTAVFFTTVPQIDLEETDTASESGDTNHQLMQPLRDLYRADVPTDEADLHIFLQDIWSNYKCTKEQCNYLDDKTKGQAVCPLWFEHRKGRITGSRAHEVLTLRETTSPSNLVRKITGSKCYYLARKQAVKWGRENEDRARAMYRDIHRTNHTEFTLVSSGLRVDPQKPFLAASTDGLVSCKCCGPRVLEIKCPYKYKDCKISEAICDKTFCLDVNKELKANHKYYTQVQLQMYVHNIQLCHFFVFANIDNLTLSIPQDHAFCERLVNKCEAIFLRYVLPELVTRKLEDGDYGAPVEEKDDNQGQQLWCLCSEPEYGRMIECENPNCPTQWYHFECVNIRRCTRGKWLCPQCEKL